MNDRSVRESDDLYEPIFLIYFLKVKILLEPVVINTICSTQRTLSKAHWKKKREWICKAQCSVCNFNV